MTRSRKKIAAGTNCVCKSQKYGKQNCNRRFRRKEHRLLNHGKCDNLPHNPREIIDEWDLGGDGKRIYTWPEEDIDHYNRMIRK